MEPIHYLRALRRRWWVIVLSVLVAGSAAFVTTTNITSLGRQASGAASDDSEYAATTILWNPGPPLVGAVTPITSMDALAQLVQLPAVATIAAKQLSSEEDPVELSARVGAVADPVTGFLNVTARAKDPKTSEAIATAFSQALITYLGELEGTQIDQRRELVLEQIETLQKRNADPTVIATLRATLAQLEVARAAPTSLMVIQDASAELIRTQSAQGFQAPKSRTSRVLLASLFGLLAGIALALVLERFDTRIRTTPSAEEAFGLPVLAEIPRIRRRRREGVVTESHPLSRAAGAFRLLQVGTQRWASDIDAAAATILVTSPEARDGKTTVAANLATAFAQAGKRVLVVSADLRRPAIHTAFDVSLEPGLTDAVRAMNGSGSAASLDLGPYLEPCAVVRLAVLPSGMIPDHPAELLGSEKMRRLIERLKKLTDVVILDAAPLVVASDVVPLVPEADGVLLVARAGKTRREIAASAASLIERVGAERVGVVMNDAREFSIPLAKRGMYQPTRKMRKAAERRGKHRADEPRTPQPQGEEQGRAQPVEEPTTVEEPTPVGDTAAAETPIVVERSADASRGQARSSVGKVQQELRDLRTQLEGFTFDLPADGVAGVD